MTNRLIFSKGLTAVKLYVNHSSPRKSKSGFNTYLLTSHFTITELINFPNGQFGFNKTNFPQRFRNVTFLFILYPLQYI